MTGPDFVYAVYSAGVDTTALTTPVLTPTPVNGDVLVVKMSTWDAATPSGASSGGGQVYTPRITGPGAGFFGYVRADTTTVAGSPGAFAVTTGGPPNPSRHSMVVEHYLASNGYSLAAVPAVNAPTSGNGAPAGTINTVGTGSILTWVGVDLASLDPAGSVPRLGATLDGLFDGHIGANSVQYFFWAAVGAPGAYVIGQTAPTPQIWSMAGLEVLFTPAAPGTPVLLHRRRRHRTRRNPTIIVVGEGAPPPPPTPADVEWCPSTPITGWAAGEVFTDWVASEPDTNWRSLTPEEDC
jgi:hypothetical protein